MPWHNSLLPFEIVRCIGVPSLDISREVINEVVKCLNESHINEIVCLIQLYDINIKYIDIEYIDIKYTNK